jgi:NRPS condensation-like uncharacterized protein
VYTAAHASEANHKLQIIIQALKRCEKKTIVIGTGHGTCTCQGAAFEYIYNVRDPYTSFCNFWKDCGGSEEKAKELIAIFFRRVNTSNTYFSTTVPGWRTDRGMIYIIYSDTY